MPVIDPATCKGLIALKRKLIDGKREYEAKRGNPCRICEKTDWCITSDEGTLCKRVSDGSVWECGNWGWLHVANPSRLSDQQTPVMNRPKRREPTDLERHTRWAPMARHLWRNQVEPTARLAKLLGVAVHALDSLKTGYGVVDGSQAWATPERSASGLIIGLALRLVEPDSEGRTKRQARGGKRGLTYCDDWDAGGPVYLVEGASDVAAGLTLGLTIIGRPSNVGGVVYLREMVAGLEAKRRLVVLAERDRKKHETLCDAIQRRHDPKCTGCAACWPGKHGARELSDKIGRRCGVRYLAGAKDLRSWLNATGIDPEDCETMFELGRREFGGRGK